MKRNKLLTLVMTLFLGLSIVLMAQTQTQAQAPMEDGIGQFCTANGDFGFSHDTCVTILNPGQGNAPTAICKFIADLVGGDIQNAGFKNHGQCVKFFNGL